MQESSTNNNNSKPADIWCVVPVYNNAATVRDVAGKCLDHVDNVLVVDDGSTDAYVSDLLKDTGIKAITHSQNMGKGRAILTALKYVRDHGGTHIITLDGDGQHSPDDIEKFISAIKKNDDAVIIGCRNFDADNVPGSSRFGRSFSNMWVRIETGLALNDTQSGFRSYPVKHLSKLSLHGHRYDFEIEVLSRAAWAGLEIKEVDVDVLYQENRVSSFHPFRSNFQISMMHTRLVGRRLLPWPHRQLVRRRQSARGFSFLKDPAGFINMLLKENATPAGLAASAAVGTILATLPIIGFHTIAIIYVTARLHLNKIMAVTIQILYSPPFVPFLCTEVGHYMRYGKWWRDFTWDSIVASLHHRLFEWLLGSLVLAPIYAIIAAAAVYSIATAILKRGRRVK